MLLVTMLRMQVTSFASHFDSEARSADVGVQDNSADEDIKLVSICPTFLQAYLHSGSNKFMINRTSP